MRGQIREPRKYELMTIFSPDVPEEEIGGQIDRVAAYVTAAGGSVQETRRDSPWGRRRLAYPIRHSGRDVRDGFYTLFHVELEPHRIEDVERELKLNDILLRHLFTSYTPQPIDPRAVEEAEIAAEDAAAAAYAAAQAEAATLVASAAAPAAAAEPATTDEPEAAAALPDTATADATDGDATDAAAVSSVASVTDGAAPDETTVQRHVDDEVTPTAEEV